jgi:hypothetical protein
MLVYPRFGGVTITRIFRTQSNERDMIMCKCAVKLSTRMRFYTFNTRLQGMGFDILSYEDTKIVVFWDIADMSPGRLLPMFRMNLLPPSSGLSIAT